MSNEKGTQRDDEQKEVVSPRTSNNLKKGEKYTSEQNVRIVTAASLFDGHDATINIIRRILQSSGAEVIHLGHNRSVTDIVECAIQEDAQGVAVSSYQGGHMEYFTYMVDLLEERKASHIKVFGGGGGVIVDEEIKQLHEAGVERIFSPEDGRTMGLQGMINEILEKCDYSTTEVNNIDPQRLTDQDRQTIARLITAVENKQWQLLNKGETEFFDIGEEGIKSRRNGQPQPIIGITVTGGAGKSSLTDELVRRFLNEF
jgi:methylmalonyl-CoA mutase